MEIGNRFFVRAIVLAATSGICAVAFAGSTGIGVPCKPCAVAYQFCLAHGGGIGECEDKYDQCMATQCPGIGAVTPLDRKTVGATSPAMLASTKVETRR